jgi:hypothetical protein
MYSAGVGVGIPVPRALARKHPAAAIVLFAKIVAPVVFAALLAGLVYLEIHR